MATSTEPVHDEHAGQDHTSHDHPGEGVYIRVALVLAVLTAIEVWLSYSPLSITLTNTSLLLFAVIKFSIVAMYFMHLKFDSKVLRRLFVTGIILAVFCYVAYLQTLHVFVN